MQLQVIMKPLVSLEGQVSLEGLVALDSHKLSEVLSAILSRLTIHEELIEDTAKTADSAAIEVSQVRTRVQEVEETTASFSRSVEDVNKMKDRVSAWSERFRTLEEVMLKLKSESSSTAEQLQAQLQDYQRAQQSLAHTFAQTLAQSQAQSRNALDEYSHRLQDKLAKTQAAQDDLQLELRLGLERVERAAVLETAGELEEVQSVGGETPAQPHVSVRSLAVRLKALESRLEGPMLTGTELEAMGVDVSLIHTEIGKDRLILELQHKLFLIAAQASQVASRLESKRPEGEVKPIKLASLHQRLEDLEAAVQDKSKHMTKTAARLKELSEQFEAWTLPREEHRAPSKELAKAKSQRRSSYQLLNTPFSRTSSLASSIVLAVPSAEPVLFQPNGEHGDELQSLRAALSVLTAAVEKVKKQVKEKLSTTEAEETLSTLVKRVVRGLPTKATLSGEGEGKTQELEGRLNNYWRLLQDVQGYAHTLKEALSELDVKLRRLVEDQVTEVQVNADEKFAETKMHVVDLQKSLGKLLEDKQTEELLENEQYLRSMVLKLKGDVQKVQAQVEAIPKQEALPPLMQDINFDELPLAEEGEARKLKAVLQQHEQAIRYLASRLVGGSSLAEEPVLLSRQDNAVALQHLEQLRSEMKEILSKHDSAKSLSSRDLELLNQIHAALDTKISKDELTAKVDRSELLRIYRQLKRRTDQLSDAVKKSESSGNIREDVIFSKKRLDAECASCGQFLPEGVDLQHQEFQPWGRFPVRTNLVGPGFSHILSSIVSSPSGSIAIPKRLDEVDCEVRSAVQSPVYSRAKRRAQVKLPSVK